ncbi:endophilin-A3 isoform X1 [Bos javanicus]|uniref:endophilin-A3 isoform X1 n=1 Tax=Bos javanicus TaxID=9906 RepID=UPI002AA62B4E|nr:endophilin-A3 isoform X1 [Bos javanicus]
MEKAREFQKNSYFCFIDYAKAFDCVDHNKLWTILKEIGIPDHLICLLRNLYAGQEPTVRTGHGTTDWFQKGKGVRQGCILSPCLFNFYAEYIRRNAGLEETQAGIKIAGRNINNLRYADDTTLMAESKEELKSLLMKLFSEKISGVEGTKLDDEFLDMERKIDITNKAVAEILSKATEYLQPNPGSALIEVGESMKLMAEVKDSLDINVKQTFIDPLQLLQDKDLKEIGHHLKKLEGRRLDYDYKKKRVGKIPDEEVRQAVEKFEESKELAERSMFNFLENDVEQVSQLAVFVEAALDYHRQSTEILQELQSKLQMRISAASNVPKREYKPRPIKRSPSELNGVSTASSAKTTVSESGKFKIKVPADSLSGSNVPMDQPCCRGLYDFEPENQGELGFKEGDIITLTNQIDENWYEGILHGESGFFPINYVEVIVPLPQ